MDRRVGVLCAGAIVLSGCVDRGISPVYTQNGVAPPDEGVIQYPNVNPLNNFKVAAQRAQTTQSAEAYKGLIRSGFSLIYVRCNEYFDKKGSDQASANLLRDSIAPLAAIVSGLLALHTYKNAANADRDIGLLALGTTTSIAGLDVYSKHFLFGAESIESVRQLVNEELNTHAATALDLEPQTMEEATIQLTDNQRICLPSHILASTRAAIAKGKFEAVISGKGGPVEADLLTKLGSSLGLTPPTVTETQAGLLFATTVGLVRTSDELKFVRFKLAGLPETANPISDDGAGAYTIKADFPFAEYKAIFDAAPAATRTYLLNRSKIILGAVTATARADAASAQKGDKKALFLAERGLPGFASQSFMDSQLSEFSFPSVTPPDSQHLRRVRVTAQ